MLFHRHTHRVVVIVAALLVLFVVVSCTAVPAATPAIGTTATAQPTPLTKAEPETAAAGTPAPAAAGTGRLVVYSGRSENLVGPAIARFEEATGIDVESRYGGTAELAATLLEEGTRSPADVFFAQDPGGLGAVEQLLAPLPPDVLERVPERYRGPEGRWVGISGRVRAVVYNTARVSEADLPQDMQGFTDPRWRGRLGWAPSNASFQTMVTAMRALWGEDETRRWLAGILANEPVTYDGNAPIVAAVGAGEVDAGFVNHYYLYRFLQEEGQDFPARNYYLPTAGPGSLVMVAGTGVLASAQNPEAAAEFVRFMLSNEMQQYFAGETYEYPLVAGVAPAGDLKPLAEVSTPDVPLAQLADLEGTVRLLRQVGALQ